MKCFNTFTIIICVGVGWEIWVTKFDDFPNDSQQYQINSNPNCSVIVINTHKYYSKPDTVHIHTIIPLCGKERSSVIVSD